MPSGARAAQEASVVEEQRRARANRMPEFYIGDGEVAFIKSLATGAADDAHFGFAEAHIPANRKTGEANEWYPCLTSYDDPVGKCRCAADQIERGFMAGKRIGIFLWCYGKLRTAPAPEAKTGQQQYVWPKVQLSVGLLELMHGLGRAETDTWHGVRYWQAFQRPMVWFRGPDYNDAFVKRFYQDLTAESNQRNLTAHPVLVTRKLQVAGANGIQGSDWQYKIADPQWNRMAGNWPEIALAQDTQEIIAEQTRYFKALPDMRAYFEGKMRWPLFDKEASTAQVPDRGTVAAQLPTDRPPTVEELQRLLAEAQGRTETPPPPAEVPTLVLPTEPGRTGVAGHDGTAEMPLLDREPTPLRTAVAVAAPDPQNITPPAVDADRAATLGKFLDG